MCSARVTAPSQENGFFQSANSSGSQFVALFSIITVMCWDDCEWRWECLFSCNCLFPTEISMSDPFIVLIIACLLFCLPACRGGRLGAAGILGSWYCWYRLCSLVSRTTAPRPGRLSGSSHPPATGCRAVSSCCLAHLGSRMLGQTWGQWRHDKGLAYFLIWD